MKRVSSFFKREWFLLVMLVAIMLIVMLFQWLWFWSDPEQSYYLETLKIYQLHCLVKLREVFCVSITSWSNTYELVYKPVNKYNRQEIDNVTDGFVPDQLSCDSLYDQLLNLFKWRRCRLQPLGTFHGHEPAYPNVRDWIGDWFSTPYYRWIWFVGTK